MSRVIVFLTAWVCCNVAAAGVFPPPLNLNTRPPQILTPEVVVTYDATYTKNVGRFTATGVPISLELDGVPPDDFVIVGTSGNRPPEWRIRANVDQETGELRWGDIRVRGNILDVSDPANPVTLVRGNLLRGRIQPDEDPFGVESIGGNGVFEFVFADLRGEIADLFSGGRVGVVLDARTDLGSNPFVDFESDFDNFIAPGVGAGSATTFVIPEPNSLAAFTFALAALALLSRRLS